MLKYILVGFLLAGLIGAVCVLTVDLGAPKLECAEEGESVSGFADSESGCAVSQESADASFDWETQSRVERTPIRTYSALILIPLGILGSLISGIVLLVKSLISRKKT